MPRTKQDMQITKLSVKGESGTEYTIEAKADGSLWCTCPGMRFQHQAAGNKRVCKHIEFVTRQFAEHFAAVRAL